MPRRDPAQGGLVDRLRVGALADLGKLLRIAEQQQPRACLGDSQCVGEGELPGLVDHQKIQGPGRNGGACHGPGRATHQGAARRTEQPVHVGGSPVVPRQGTVVLDVLGNPPRVHSRFFHGGAEEVLHHRVRLGDDAHLPAPGHEPRNDM
ncbi:hypothetical protein D9M72_391840 [compost metagenome]